jgi:biopolymer transport protein ExbB
MKLPTLLRSFLSILFLLCLHASLTAQPLGYGYVKTITVLETQIPGATGLTDFPLLVNLTDTELRTVANGGHMGTAAGYDLLFYQNGCDTKLDHQLEEYNPATGKLVVWIRVPFLSAVSNTTVYMYYGNDSVTVNPSSTSVWNSNYQGVWHLNTSPVLAAPQVNDGTSFGRNGSSYGGMTGSNLVTGKIGPAYSFDEVNDYVRVPDFLYGQEHTVSFWFNASEVNGTAYQYMFSHGSNPKWDTTNSLHVYIGENNVTGSAGSEIHNRQMIKSFYRDSNDWWDYDTLNAGTTYIDGNWHYYTFRVQDFGGASIFIDGSLIRQYTVWGGNTFDPGSDIYLAARYDLNGQRFFGGMLDEVRIANGWRTSAWIATEYNNQQDPSSFYIVGPEGPSMAFCIVLPLSIWQYTAQVKNNTVMLRWTFEDVKASDKFCIMRSGDGEHWQQITSINGRPGLVTEEYIDNSPIPGKSYYFIKVIDSDGSHVKYSSIAEVKVDFPLLPGTVTPNPANAGNTVFISCRGVLNPTTEVSLMNNSGAVIARLKPGVLSGKGFSLVLPSTIAPGLYFAVFNTGTGTSISKIIIQ